MQYDLDVAETVLLEVIISQPSRFQCVFSRELFSDKRKQLICSAFFKCFHAGRSSNMRSVCDYLLERGELQQAGGIKYVANFFDKSHRNPISRDFLADYFDVVERKAFERQVKMIVQDFDASISDFSDVSMSFAYLLSELNSAYQYSRIEMQ